MKTKVEKLTRVFNFSGGPSSALMTILNYKDGDYVIFCDTKREDKGTYEFIDDFEFYEKIPVIRIQYSKNPFQDLIAKRKAVPNMFKRFCTPEMKIKTAKRWLKKQGVLDYINYIGFRHDERKRIENGESKFKRVTNKFPLNEIKVNENYVDQYWKNKPYRLKIPKILKNCDACFMKGENAVLSIFRKFPEKAEPWISDEELCFQITGKRHTYFKDVSMKQLLHMASMDLFSEKDLEEINPAYSCSCTF